MSESRTMRTSESKLMRPSMSKLMRPSESKLVRPSESKTMRPSEGKATRHVLSPYWYAAIVCGLLLLLTVPVQAQSIVIDPGHGGNDPGGTGNSMEEKDIVLDISLQFAKLLEDDTLDTNGGGTWTVSVSRTTDEFIPLAARSAFANSLGADRFMSIHANAFGDISANGTETFSAAEGTISAQLRDLVQEEMISAWGLRNRGSKTAGFSVLVNTSMPAELHELGFITNSTDIVKLASPEQRQLAAEAHLRAIQRHYGITPYIPRPGEPPNTAPLSIVVSSPTGPLAGASVEIDETPVVETTNENGIVVIANVEVGAHLIAVSAEGYKNAQDTATVILDQPNTLAFTLQPTDVEGCDPLVEDCSVDEEVEVEDPVTGCGCDTGSTGSGPAGVLFLLLAMLYSRRRRLL